MLFIVEGAELKLISCKGRRLPNRRAQVQERLEKCSRLEIVHNLKRADTRIVIIPRCNAGSHQKVVIELRSFARLVGPQARKVIVTGQLDNYAVLELFD